MGYISTAEANAYLDTSGQDTLIGILIEQASELINRICGVSTFSSGTITNERHEYNSNGPYYFENSPVNAISAINGSAVTYTEGTDYIKTGRRIEFASHITINTKNTYFDFVEFTYTSGYSPIPEAIKSATKIIVAGLYATRKGLGIESYTQGDVSVTYSKESILGDAEAQNDLVSNFLAPYILMTVYS